MNSPKKWFSTRRELELAMEQKPCVCTKVVFEVMQTSPSGIGCESEEREESDEAFHCAMISGLLYVAASVVLDAIAKEGVTGGS